LASKAAGYARYSTQKQDGGVTIETQEEEIRRVCQLKGWEYYKTFKDEAVSGATPMEDRAGLTELFDEAERRQFDMVMVLDNSRLARDQKVFWDAISRMRALGITYTTVMMPDMDSTKPEFEMIGGTMQGMASYERRLVSFKTKLAMKNLKEKGRWVSRPKLGFKINGEGKLEPIDWGLKVVEMLRVNPKMKASMVHKELPVSYYQAWELLNNCKEYLGIL